MTPLPFSNSFPFHPIEIKFGILILGGNCSCKPLLRYTKVRHHNDVIRPGVPERPHVCLKIAGKLIQCQVWFYHFELLMILQSKTGCNF